LELQKPVRDRQADAQAALRQGPASTNISDRLVIMT
jgi:hypothetical protein